MFDHSLITVHPLGGCGMADDASNGVVNERCQVYSANAGDDVHKGLFVCDGSVLPTSVGVNPLFTITALAERAMQKLADDKGWTIQQGDSVPTHEPYAPELGIQFTEKMAGTFGTGITDSFEHGAEKNEPLSFVLTVTSDNLKAMQFDPDHAANIFGSVSAPFLSEQNLTVNNGNFYLFKRNPETVNGRLMRYELPLVEVVMLFSTWCTVVSTALTLSVQILMRRHWRDLMVLNRYRLVATLQKVWVQVQPLKLGSSQRWKIVN